MKKRLLSLLLVLLFMAGMPVQALAATHEVGDFAGLSHAFETDTDAEVTVNLTADVDAGGNTLTAGSGQSYTIHGNNNTLSNVAITGPGEVTINADMSGTPGEDGFYAALTVTDGTVNLNGDVEGFLGIIADHSTVVVDGTIDTEISALEVKDSRVTLLQDVDGGYIGIDADNSTVKAEGQVSGVLYGVNATNGSRIQLQDNVTGGIEATDSEVHVQGGSVEGSLVGVNASNSLVTVDGNVKAEVFGVNADAGSRIRVQGSVSSSLIGVDAADGSQVQVGSVTGDVNAEDSRVQVNGSVTGNAVGVYAQGSADVQVNGNVTGELMGVYAGEDSTVTVNGYVHGELPVITEDDAKVTINEPKEDPFRVGVLLQADSKTCRGVAWRNGSTLVLDVLTEDALLALTADTAQSGTITLDLTEHPELTQLMFPAELLQAFLAAMEAEGSSFHTLVLKLADREIVLDAGGLTEALETGEGMILFK